MYRSVRQTNVLEQTNELCNKIRSEIWTRLKSISSLTVVQLNQEKGTIDGIEIEFTVLPWGQSVCAEFRDRCGNYFGQSFSTRTKKNGDFNFAAAVGAILRYVGQNKSAA